MRPLSIEIKNAVLEKAKNGESTRKIANFYKIGQRSVARIIANYKNSNPNQSFERKSGRPQKITDTEARALGRSFISGKINSVKEAVSACSVDVSRWTVQRALKSVGYKASVKKKKPKLSPKNVKSRKSFFDKYKSYTVLDWQKVIWSDETKINRYQSDGKVWYWAKPSTTPNPSHVSQTIKHGGGSLMVWGCITPDGVGPLVRIEGIMRKEDYLRILQDNLPVALAKMPDRPENVTFQHDNDPKHSAKIVKEWLSSQVFGVMEWPPQSPDLNPIENLWAYLKRRLAEYKEAPKSINELWERVQAEWKKIPIDYVAKLYNSMPNRMNQLKKAKGYWINY